MVSIKPTKAFRININIANDSTSLPDGFVSDPADCIIIASTREVAGTLITCDRKILDWANKGYLKTIRG